MKLLDRFHGDENAVKQHNKGYSLSLIKADVRIELPVMQLKTANSCVLID